MIHSSTFLTPAPVTLLHSFHSVVLRLQNPGAYCHQCVQQAWRHAHVTAILQCRCCFLLEMNFILPSISIYSLVSFLEFESEIKYLIFSLSWHFFTNNLTSLVSKFYLLKLCYFQFFHYCQHRSRDKIQLYLLSNFYP
jgi:hypothetical protein